MKGIQPLDRLLLRCLNGRWHVGISTRGQHVVATTTERGRTLANLLPLATKAEADSYQAQLAEAFDDFETTKGVTQP